MDNNKLNTLTEEKQYKAASHLAPNDKKRPDDLSGINIEARFMISDPKTGAVLVKGRG